MQHMKLHRLQASVQLTQSVLYALGTIVIAASVLLLWMFHASTRITAFNATGTLKAELGSCGISLRQGRRAQVKLKALQPEGPTTWSLTVQFRSYFDPTIPC